MPWVRAFHLVFVIAWFAGLFYLPRLFVYHAQTSEPACREQFKVMERKLFWFVTPFAVITALLGGWLLAGYAWEAYRHSGWLHAKLALVLLLYGYHGWCWLLLRDFARDRNRHGHIWYRWFNEVPVLLLLGIVVLVIVKPF